MHDPSTPSAEYRIHCPYCDTPFCLTLEKTDNTVLSLTPTDEVMALPYARDVDIFDPPTDQTNSRWSPIGQDFFGGINYDRWLGILRIPPDLKMYYCVARCPECGAQTQDQVNKDGKLGLIDVFANLTSDTLSAIWPQLFSHEPSDQRPCPAKRDARAQESLSPKAIRLFVPRDFMITT